MNESKEEIKKNLTNYIMDLVKQREKELENKYHISISFNGKYYMVFNYFGALWFTSPSLNNIEEEMEKIYESR